MSETESTLGSHRGLDRVTEHPGGRWAGSAAVEDIALEPIPGADETAALLEDFRRDLVDLHERLGKPALRKMADKRKHEPGTSGTKDTLGKLTRYPMTKAPSPTLLRGFIIGVGLSADEADIWEKRRQDLVGGLQRIQKEAGASAESTAPPSGDRPPRVDEVASVKVRRRIRRKRHIGRLWIIGVVTVAMVVVVAVLVAVVTARGGGRRGAVAGNLVTVTGRVECASGAPVVGVYVADSGKDNFASFHAEEKPSVASWAYSVAKGHSYSVHVGCGGTPATWATENRSDDVTGSSHLFVCADGRAISEHSYYGSCQEHQTKPSAPPS